MKIKLVSIIIKHPKKVLTILCIDASDESDNMLKYEEYKNEKCKMNLSAITDFPPLCVE